MGFFIEGKGRKKIPIFSGKSGFSGMKDTKSYKSKGNSQGNSGNSQKMGISGAVLRLKIKNMKSYKSMRNYPGNWDFWSCFRAEGMKDMKSYKSRGNYGELFPQELGFLEALLGDFLGFGMRGQDTSTRRAS